MPFIALASAVLAGLVGRQLHSVPAGFTTLVVLFILGTLALLRSRANASRRDAVEDAAENADLAREYLSSREFYDV